MIKTYNSEDSLVVTHPTTNSPACGLSTAERTGSPVFHTLWSKSTPATQNLDHFDHNCDLIYFSTITKTKIPKYAKEQPVSFKNAFEKLAIIGAGGIIGSLIAAALLETGKHTVARVLGKRDGARQGAFESVVDACN
ncbi:hypothetical protein AAEP93_010693 [Penicillium crustosum]